MNDLLLEIKDLSVTQNDHLIIDDVSFEVKKGETVALIGPNGAGKTTIFRSILGFVPYSGTIDWKEKIAIGYVPQRLYVERDLPLTTSEFFSTKESDSKKVIVALADVGLANTDHILNSPLGVLSGGELQRVLIAWALLGNPKVLLFDEPTAGVDLAGEETIYALLNKLKTKSDLTILLISHELNIVFKYATQVVCINKTKICAGPPNLALTKKTLDKLFDEEVTVYKHSHK